MFLLECIISSKSPRVLESCNFRWVDWKRLVLTIITFEFFEDHEFMYEFNQR